MTLRRCDGRAVLVARRPDAMSLVSFSVWWLFLVPASLVVTVLGAVGQPALLISILGALLWLHGKASLRVVGFDHAPNPIRWALLLYLAYLTLNYSLLQTRSQTALEATSSTRSMIVAFALVGLALLVCDASPGRDRLDLLVRTITYAATAAASVAFVQFFFGFDLAAKMQFPGLSFGATEYDAITDRAGLNRSAGTMMSPLELGVVMGAVLPLGVHTARHLAKRPRLAWVGVFVIGAASMLSVSRSGILAAGAALAVLSLAWTWRQRANAGIATVVLVGAMWAIAPGLISTFRWFFTNIEYDDSAQARIERFPLVLDVMSERPWFGRGTGTFTVEEGQLLDQQLYQTFIELGIIGTLVTLALLTLTVVVGVSIWRRSPQSEEGHLSLALTGAVVALSVTGLTYTAFFYRVHLTLLLLAIGALGGLWRLTLHQREVPPLMRGSSQASRPSDLHRGLGAKSRG
jgi:polysaccharide biosynthesis protein PslJ